MTVFRDLPLTLRVPLVAAVFMILLGLVASRSVLGTLGRLQDARLTESAHLHIDGLSVALGPFVLRKDVWEVYDILERARSALDGQRLTLAVVADDRGQVLAASAPRRAPVGSAIAPFEAGAMTPRSVRMTGDPMLRVAAPLAFQGREVGHIVIEIDVTDMLAERRRVVFWLIAGNAAATLVLTLGGWFAVSRILRPVQLLIGAMDGAEGAPRPVREADIPRGDPGAERLIRTYNRMSAAVEARADAERRIAERERFVSLGRLSSSLAHEINNPLGGLLNAADTIQTYADRPEVVRQSAALMLRGLAHMRDVARAILDQHRLDRIGQPLRPEDFDDLRLLFGAQVTSRDQRLDWCVAAPAPAMAGLPAAPVRQIALNLLLNAGAAAGNGGRLRFAVLAEADGIQLTVADSGPGIGPENLDRLMNAGPLPDGGGEGLRLVRDLVVRLGGSILHRRTRDETVIRVVLPAGGNADA